MISEIIQLSEGAIIALISIISIKAFYNSIIQPFYKGLTEVPPAPVKARIEVPQAPVRARIEVPPAIVKARIEVPQAPRLLLSVPKEPKLLLSSITEPLLLYGKTEEKPRFKKAKNDNRKANFEKLTKTDISDLKDRVDPGVFKNLTYIQLAFLKTMAISQGIDDWISCIDSKLLYEENKVNFISLFGHTDSDNELIDKANRYEAMAEAYNELC